MGWLRDFLAAPKRLRQLGHHYELLVDRHRLLKVEVKRIDGELKMARRAVKSQLLYWHERLAAVDALEKENERLRKLNGETNQKYVVAQDAYDRLLQGKARRF